MTSDDRISRLEGITEEIRNRLGSMDARMNSIDGRLNTLLVVMVAMWGTTMLAVISTLVAILMRT
jgi:tetrahydromethanopterin S-methyltransferase subunit B